MGCIKSKNDYKEIINDEYKYVYVENINELSIIVRNVTNKLLCLNKKKLYYLELNNIVLPSTNYGISKCNSWVISKLHNILKKLILNRKLKIKIVNKYNTILIADVWLNDIYFNNYLKDKRLAISKYDKIPINWKAYYEYGINY